MFDQTSCEESRALAVELALGVAAGDERATAVRHLEGCHACRVQVAEFAEVLDELLLLSPEREPPPGFESRVLAPMIRGDRTRRWRRILAMAAAAALASVLAGGSVWLATQSDRRMAGLFRSALERADGKYFGVEFLHSSSGARVGHTFVYGGVPSWMFVVIRDPAHAGAFHVDVVTRAEETIRVGSLEIPSEDDGGGLTTPIDLREIGTIRLVPQDGGDALEANLPMPPPGSD